MICKKMLYQDEVIWPRVFKVKKRLTDVRRSTERFQNMSLAMVFYQSEQGSSSPGMGRNE